MLSGLIAATMVLSTGCRSETPRKLRIGINPWPGYEFIYLAAERGIFARHGLDVEVEEYTSLADVRRAYERGQIDAMTSTVVEVLEVLDQSPRRPRIVLVSDASEGGDVILARPGIPGMAALRGKAVGAEMASVGAYMLWRAADIAGLRVDSMRVVELDQLEMEGAARQGLVDAVVAYPPVSVAMARLGWRPVFDSRQIPGEVIDVLSVDETVLRANPGLHEQLLDTWRDSLAYFAAHRTEALAMMAAREGLSPAEFEDCLATVRLIGAAGVEGYLRRSGPLRRILGDVDTVLRRSGRLRGPNHVDQAVAYLPEPSMAGTGEAPGR